MKWQFTSVGYLCYKKIVEAVLPETVTGFKRNSAEYTKLDTKKVKLKGVAI